MTLFDWCAHALLRNHIEHAFANPTWIAFVVALLGLFIHYKPRVSPTLCTAESAMGLFYLLTLYCLLRAHSTETARGLVHGSDPCLLAGYGK